MNHDHWTNNSLCEGGNCNMAQGGHEQNEDNMQFRGVGGFQPPALNLPDENVCSSTSSNQNIGLSLHEDHNSVSSTSERGAPEGELLIHTREEEQEIRSNMRPRRIAVQYADLAHMDKDLETIIGMYFGTKQLSGGGKITRKRLSHDKMTLFITFENAVSEDLLQREHMYHQKKMKVTPLEPESDQVDLADRCLVFGISLAGKDVYFFRKAVPYLHNFLKQHDIETKEMEDNEDLGAWVCTLRNESDIGKIFRDDSNETTITIEGMTMTLFKVTNDDIDSWIDGSVEDDKVLLSSLPSSIEPDEIKSFVEENSTNIVRDIRIQSKKALVILDKPTDFQGLAKAIHRIPLKGYMIGIQKVPLSLSLLISGSGKELDEEELKIKFSHFAQECTRNETECFVDGIVLHKTRKSAIVKFLDRQVLDEVLALGDHIGTLKLYHECLDEELFNSS